jgi:hypothetical protein
MLTQKILKEVLHYNPDTGIFTWLISPNSIRKIGSTAGSKNGRGYIYIGLFNCSYKAHRLAWFYMTGYFPKNTIDHINRVTDDNRFCNLREATQQENCFNSGMKSTNKSGYKGVSFRKDSGKWKAQININGKRKNLGSYETAEIAFKNYVIAAEKHYKEFAFNQVSSNLNIGDNCDYV